MWFISSLGPWNETKRRTKSGHRAPFVWLRCFCCFAQWFRQKFTPAVRKDFSSKSLELKKKRKSSFEWTFSVISNKTWKCIFFLLLYLSPREHFVQLVLILVFSRVSDYRPCHTRQFVLATCNAIFAEKNIAGCSWDIRCTQLVLRPAISLYFTPAEYLKMSAAFWLCRIVIGSFSKNCETSCSGGVTRCNLSRSIAKSRSCFYFLCNLERNFSLRTSCKHGALYEEVFLATFNATSLRWQLQGKLPRACHGLKCSVRKLL